ncbi:MAG: alpha-E domain-containing protein, partial [Gammaproteobacteria bacterium]
MLSRVADNLYWFARYVRRAENTARLVGVGSQLQLDLPRSIRFTWRPMIDTVGASEAFAAHFSDTEEPTDGDVVRFLLLDPRNPSSLRASIERAREILRTIRDSLPQQTWEAVNDLFLYVSENGDRGAGRSYRSDFLGHVVDGCLKILGVLTANASRDIGFRFMQLGTVIEQADMTTRIIDAGASGLIRPRHDDDVDVFRSMQRRDDGLRGSSSRKRTTSTSVGSSVSEE